MRLSALYNNVCVVASSVSSLCAIVYYVTIAPYNSKMLCLLKRARKGQQVQVCSSALFVIRGIELSHDLAMCRYFWI